MQVEIAIDEVDMILFVVNGKEGITNDDEYIVPSITAFTKSYPLQ